MASFGLQLRTWASLHPDGEPDEYVSEYDGTLTCYDDATDTQVNVGRVRALRVHAALAREHGMPLFDVCDCHSQELHELQTLLYLPRGHDFKTPLIHRFEAEQPDLLVVDYVILKPRWRKLRLGLLAVRKLVDLVGGGCGLVVSEVAPLRRAAHKELRVPKSWLPRREGAAGRQAATVKLRGYFRRMGFERLGRTPYYALPTALQTPTADELLKGQTDLP